MLPQASRAFRDLSANCESPPVPEAIPFLQTGSSSSSSHQSLDLDPADLEDGILSGDKNPRISSQPYPDSDDDYTAGLDEFPSSSARSSGRLRWRLPSLFRLVLGRRASLGARTEKRAGRIISRRPSALRRMLRITALLLMLLGLLHLITLACGFWLSLFPDELPWPENTDPSGHFSDDLGHWPTDVTADISPVACHSHNDYWRKEPLFSAIHASCTSVEADVWLFDDDLFVGHNTASLTPARTLRSLYIDPLLQILDQTNPTTSFHPDTDLPRNGIFDTDPQQTLVLLIDFKQSGDTLWPHVYSQLQPLRDGRYLTYYNGTSVVEGPITVVGTGNTPFDKVVENQSYRDIFFDAPLELMDEVPIQKSSAEDKSNEPYTTRSALAGKRGQGFSGSAPLNPMVYSPANSYYASVSFSGSILHFPTMLPWRKGLTDTQVKLIRKQIAGAHARGLKVRYWSVPEWPKGMRNYLWRVLVKEGVDYLNVDDLKAATTETWLGKNVWEAKEKGWWSA